MCCFLFQLDYFGSHPLVTFVWLLTVTRQVGLNYCMEHCVAYDLIRQQNVQEIIAARRTSCKLRQSHFLNGASVYVCETLPFIGSPAWLFIQIFCELLSFSSNPYKLHKLYSLFVCFYTNKISNQVRAKKGLCLQLSFRVLWYKRRKNDLAVFCWVFWHAVLFVDHSICMGWHSGWLLFTDLQIKYRAKPWKVYCMIAFIYSLFSYKLLDNFHLL